MNESEDALAQRKCKDCSFLYTETNCLMKQSYYNSDLLPLCLFCISSAIYALICAKLGKNMKKVGVGKDPGKDVGYTTPNS